jgi:hypothetical protein
MPVPLNYLNSIASYIFLVGLEPWNLTKFLESSPSLLASDIRIISRRRECEGELSYCTDEGRENAGDIERYVDGLVREGYKT